MKSSDFIQLLDKLIDLPIGAYVRLDYPYSSGVIIKKATADALEFMTCSIIIEFNHARPILEGIALYLNGKYCALLTDRCIKRLKVERWNDGE